MTSPRPMVDWGQDKEELADELGLGEFSVAGHSGGAPHALAIPMTMALWDWGFRPEDITHHVEVFYGDADDLLDPAMPKHVADRLPDCTAHVWPGAGHYGFVDRERWTDFFGAVA